MALTTTPPAQDDGCWRCTAAAHIDAANVSFFIMIIGEWPGPEAFYRKFTAFHEKEGGR